MSLVARASPAAHLTDAPPKDPPVDLLRFLLIAACVPALAFADPLAGPAVPMVGDPPGLPPADAMPGATLAEAVELLRSGDLERTRAATQRLVDRRAVRGADRVRAWFLLGWVSSELGHHQQASAAFYRVRKLDDHPLAEHAAFFEARADLRRGHHSTAIAECDAYATRFPEGAFGDECALLIADAHLALGNRRAAAERYEQFLQEHPDDQRQEAIALRMATALEESGEIERAAERYRHLYVYHRLPTTARKASEALERLEAWGVDLPALSDEQLYTRACSLRTAGQFDASYELFCELDERNPGGGDDATALGKRLDSERYDFLWRNRKYAEAGAMASRRYNKDPSASGASEQLYKAVRGYSKAGEWKLAVQHQETGRSKHPRSRRFRNTPERSAMLYTANKQFPQARAAWVEWMGISGRARRSRKTRFLGAYSAFKAKDYPAAIEELGKLSRGNDLYATGARYWRGRAFERQKKWQDARREFDAIRKNAADSWYALLLTERARRKDPVDTVLRDGRWPASEAPPQALPHPRTAPSLAGLVQHGFTPGSTAPPLAAGPVRRDSDGRTRPPPMDPWSDLELLGSTDAPALTPPRASLAPSRVPPTWSPSPHLDLGAADRIWRRFVEEHEQHWPQLPTAYELSRIGLGELAGPLLSQVYQEVRDVRRNRRKRNRVAAWRSRGGQGGSLELARWAAILDLRLAASDWRQMFAAAGYPASVSAFATESIRFANEDRTTDAGRGAWSLRFPAAFAPHVWRAGWRYDVDPLLLLSIMRAESLYRHDAVSRAGALGLIQVMPATGARVAALMGESAFRVEELLTPEANIRLGAFYLGQLLTRFEGEFPLAVGSYNGGPHNIGRWLKNKVGQPLDEFVEEIAFDESRHYIKKVTSYYIVYTALYTDGHRVALPDLTLADDSSVIDF